MGFMDGMYSYIIIDMYYREVKADRLLFWWSRLNGMKGSTKAAAFFPFIFTTSAIHPNMKEYFINHERIHCVQQIEKVFLGQWIFSILENFYYRIFKGKSSLDTYLNKASEQEAYHNMFDLSYLKNRRVFADIRVYLKHKPASWNSFYKRSLEAEGFPIVYEWFDEPNTKYPLHKHQGKVSFYVLDGTVTFTDGIKKTISTFERIDVPPDIEHSAIVGPQGCRYVVGQEIEGDA